MATADNVEDAELADESPIRFATRRRRDDVEMDITPMIDMTFLLLIFFLVTSRMGQGSIAKLPEAEYGTAVATKTSVVLLVRRGEGAAAIVSKPDGTDLSSDPREQEEQIIAYVTDGLEGIGEFDEPKQHVLIKADRDVKHREVSRVAAAVGRVEGVGQLFLAVREGS